MPHKNKPIFTPAFRRRQALEAQEDKLFSGISEQIQGLNFEGISGEQRSTLFAGIQRQAEAGARSTIGDLSARFGGDTSSPIFNLLANQANLGARAGSGVARAQIDIDEVRRRQEINLQRGQLALGLGQLGIQRGQLGVQRSQLGLQRRKFNAQRSDVFFNRLQQQRAAFGNANRSSPRQFFGADSASVFSTQRRRGGGLSLAQSQFGSQGKPG